MAIRPDYDVGLITLVSGSAEFATSGASLQSAAVLGGDSIITPSGDVLIIEEITGQNTGKLFLPCPPSAAGNDLPLRIRYQPDGSRYQGAVRELIARWGASGNVDALAGLVGSADKIPYFTGIGTMSLVDMSSLGGGGSGGSWDALVGTLAGRDVFNGEDEGYRVLVIDNGNGQAVIYQKTGPAAGDWSAAIPFTGDRGNDGPPNTLTIGSVTEGPVAYASITGTSPNQVLNLVLQPGEKGDTGDVTPEALDAAQRAEAAAVQAIDNAALTNQDAIATAADRVQTGLDRAAASNSATEASNHAIASSASADDASASAAQVAIDKDIVESAKTTAVSAASDAETAKTAAENAKTTAVSAASDVETAKTAAENAKTTAVSAASDAETAKDFAYQWSSAPEGQVVDDGDNSGYSAYHWSKVAETAAGGGIQSVNGKTGANITLDASDVGAATAAQGGKADTALQTLTAGSNINITGTGTSRTIAATVPAQVQSDWNATSGLGQILNKPVLSTVATSGSYNDLTNKPALGTAATQNVGYFATAAQGAKADSAVQTISAGSNITVSKTGTTYTVNATATPQVQSDWNATSGLGQILNKPTLGTAAAQNVGYFATAAQGSKADSALQTLTAGTNITISGTGTSRTINATVPANTVTSVNSKVGPTVTLTASDVGALPASGTAADSSKFGNQTPAQWDAKIAAAGIYTGTAAGNTNFPIGQPLVVGTESGAQPSRNSNVRVAMHLTDTSRYVISNSSQLTALSGTWKFFGGNGAASPALVVRIA